MSRFAFRKPCGSRWSARNPGLRRALAAACALGLLLLQGASCTHVPIAPVPPPPVEQPERKPTVAAEPPERVVLQHALMLLREGKWAESRGMLEGLMRGPQPCAVCPTAYFYIGLLDLLEAEDAAQLEKVRDWMQAYAALYPGGPFMKSAEEISQVLEKQVEKHRKDQQRLKTLTQKSEEQEKEIEALKYQIETLRYQIQELENISREDEQKRDDLGLGPVE
ncbi:MAG: hypothetical protein AB1640_14680 [bacterium]